MASSLFRLISKTSRFLNCRREIMTSASRILSLSSSPLLMLPPSNDDDKANMNFYSLAHNKVGCIKGGSGLAFHDDTKLVGSSHGWLGLLNVYSLELFLWNPVSRRRINLPSIQTLPLSESDLEYGPECVRKLIVCSSGGGEGEWRVVISYGREQRLAFCRPGGEWTPIGDWYHDDDGVKTPRFYEDFAYSAKQNRLFCITQYSCLERWDLDDINPKIDASNADHEEIEEPNDVSIKEVKYVVVSEHSDEVFVVARNIMREMNVEGSYMKLNRVYRQDEEPSCFFYENFYQNSNYFASYYPYKTVGFDVCKIDENMRMPASSMDGLVMFLGRNHSFALPVAEFPELQSDSIYFTDDMDLVDTPNCGFGGHDLGIFDYENERFSSCYYPDDVRGITRISPSPFWFTPTCH